MLLDVNALQVAEQGTFLVSLLNVAENFHLHKLELTKQMEFRPPEKQMSNFDLGVTLILFYRVSLVLYSMFFNRHSLHIYSFL